MLNKLLIFIILFSLSTDFYPCTGFVIKSEAGVVLCKNLDWDFADGYIIVNQRGEQKTAIVNENLIPLQWKAQYGSVTFNQFGYGMPLGGMNEKGLVMEELSYFLTSCPDKENIPALNEFQLIQYVLDNFRNVEEAAAVTREINVSALMFRLHYILTDAEGNSSVIEFHKSGVSVYTGKDLPVEALSNNSYSECLDYSFKFKAFGGERELPKGNQNCERFVIAGAMADLYTGDKDITEYGFGILDKVRMSDTQWSIVYNPTSMTISFRTVENGGEEINLGEFNFGDGKILFKDINKQERFSELTIENNNILVENIFEKLTGKRFIKLEQAENLRNSISGLFSK